MELKASYWSPASAKGSTGQEMGKKEPSLSGENMRFLDCETAKHTKLPQFVHTDGWVSFS